MRCADYCAAVNRPGRTTNGRTTSGRTLLLDAVLVAIAALVILVPVLELWDADLDVPLAYVRGDPGVYTYEPDAPFYEMLAKGGIDNLWFFTNPDLGAPFHQQLFDFPVGLDNLNLVGLKVLGTVTGDVGATVNIFFVLTFAAVAVSMLLVLRALGASRGVAAVIALLYAYLPYHFTRGVPHLFLSSYWVVPLAAYLVLRVASASPPFTTERDDGAGWRVRVWSGWGWLWLLACVAIASSGAYYAAFTLLFLVVLGAVDFIARRRRRVLASAAIAIVAIGAIAAVNLAPTFVYMARARPGHRGGAAQPVGDRVRRAQDLPAGPAGRAAPHPGARRRADEEHQVHADPQRARPAARRDRRTRLRRAPRRAARRDSSRPARTATGADRRRRSRRRVRCRRPPKRC